MSRLSGKSLVVIGGTTGLGLAAARAFVENGASVVMVGRNPESGKRAAEQLGSRAISLAGDAGQSKTAAEAVELCATEFGRFDGLYHVAGGSGRKFGDGPLHELTDEGVSYTLQLNLQSAIFSARAAVRYFMKENRGGSILLMGSVLGYSPSARYFGTHAYAASKGGIIGFAKSTAGYYAQHNIRINVLAPALVATPMAQRAAEDEEILTFIRTKQPLDGGRIGLPEDCSDAAVYFLSDASAFTTGQVLAVDGGWCVSDGQIPI